jgi:DNA-3-methyladenine glycosylase
MIFADKGKIGKDYFIRNNTLWLARDLIGKYLLCNPHDEGICGGIITETEVYMGPEDRASHAWGNRRTRRTEVMFHEGGLSYVYLCYGIHHLFNIVTGEAEIPHAILIRAVKPAVGAEIMERRLNKRVPLLFNGPGVLTRAMGIKTTHSGLPLDGNQIWLENRGIEIPEDLVISGPRIGVDYAGEDALLPWRFFIKPADTVNITVEQ